MGRFVKFAAKHVTASASTRTISGVATRYGEKASASTGPVSFAAGSITVSDDPTRVKLLIDHDTRQPVGYLTAFASTDTELTTTFHVPDGEAGDRALHEAANGLRDGLSVGVWAEDDGYQIESDGSVTITAGTLREVTLCALPAFDDARVTDVAATKRNESNMPNPPAPAFEHHGEALGTALAAAVAPVPTAPAPAVAAAVAPIAASPVAHTAPRPLSVRAAAELVRTAYLAGGTGAVKAALSDVLVADLPGTQPDGYLGELWRARRVARPFIDSINRAPLPAGLRIYGFKWTIRPQVRPYEGNKTAIHSNKPKTELVDAEPRRWAGGWDVDRILVDRGGPDIIEALWNGAVDDYAIQTEAQVVIDLLAAATAVPASPTLTTSLVGLGGRAAAIGANISFVGFAPDVWAGFANLTRDEVPWWLGAGDSINIGTTEGTAGGMRLFSDPNLASGVVLAGDKNAATYYEETPPVRVNAVDIANGGVDLGLFGYDGLIVNDERALLKTSVVPVIPEV